MNKSQLYKKILPSVGPIIFRNIFILVNAVIFGVVILLFIFGNAQSGLFLGIIAVINTVFVIIQDIHARMTLEELQMLTALRVIRIGKDGVEDSVLAESVIKGYKLKIAPGDQIPCDGILVSAQNVEVNTALITGESDSFPKKVGEKISAGSVVTAGSGIFEAENSWNESRLAHITEDVKKYAIHPSSIQRATNTIIKYAGYILLLVIVIVVTRGFLLHRSSVEMIMNIGALASTIVPQGLLVVITLLFAIGASSYSKRHVLFQEINATEKLGRIKNLCMDKTGTLTDTAFEVDEMYTYGNISKESALGTMSLYIKGSGDSSQVISTVERYMEKYSIVKSGEIVKGLSFASVRKYGGIVLKGKDETEVILVGTPDIFVKYLSNPQDKKWFTNILETHAKTGKRILCAVRSDTSEIPKELSETKDFKCVPLCLFVFSNAFRVGVDGAIDFFQKRGVCIRILSGDNADTVKAVAIRAGVNNPEKIITGAEMQSWSESDFEKLSSEYTIFAQVSPEQKVALVSAFKKSGFTAMVGDGINDALAMKKADLGIAMFDGVPVTRQLAGVILMDNSFADLPGAVHLADNFIRSIEISAGVYINQSVAGLLLFFILGFLGFSFPLAPLNITLMNYFTIGLPGILITYWALRPSGNVLPTNSKTFLSRVMPFVFGSAIIESITIAIIFILSPEYLKTGQPNTLVMLGFVVCGFIFLLLAPRVYYGFLAKKEKIQFLSLAVVEIFVIIIILNIPLLVQFFDVTLPFPTLLAIGSSIIVLIVFGIIQYIMTKLLFLKKG